MSNLNGFFLPGIEFNLVNVTYNSVDLNNEDSDFTIHCSDSLETNLNQDEITLIVRFTRKVYLEPKALFELSISLDAFIKINPDLKEKINDIDFRKELLNNDETIIIAMASKSSLLISQITSATGQSPIITPPNFISKK